MSYRYRGFQLLSGLAACLSLINTAEAGKVRVLTRVINPVYHSAGKDGPPVRLIQYQAPKPESAQTQSPPAAPIPNAAPTPNAQPAPSAPSRPCGGCEPYPFAFNSFGSNPGAYPYNATPRVYGQFPVPLEALNNGGLIPYGYGFGGYYGYAPYAGFAGFGYPGWGWGAYAPYGFGAYGFNSGIYYGGAGFGYRFGPTYPMAINVYAGGGYYSAYAPGFIGNPYYGATQWPGYIPDFQAVVP